MSDRDPELYHPEGDAADAVVQRMRAHEPERCLFTGACRCSSCLNEPFEDEDQDDDDFCALCGVYLEPDGLAERDEEFPHLCAECGDDTADDGPYVVPDEFPDDDEQHDIPDEELIT